MAGYLALILHAHLPFVRHPEHERFLEENWLFEAITEAYIPLLQLLERWRRDGLNPRLTLTLTPTLCAMLRDPLLQARYERHLNELIELAEKEIHRTRWERPFHELALFYQGWLGGVRDTYAACRGDLVGAFRQFQESGHLEIVTSAATHAPKNDEPEALAHYFSHDAAWNRRIRFSAPGDTDEDAKWITHDLRSWAALRGRCGVCADDPQQA